MSRPGRSPGTEEGRIVRPGVTIDPADNSYGEQVLEPSLLRC